MQRNKTKVIVTLYTNDPKDEIGIHLLTEDGSPFTAQMIIDALGDYLLIDPAGVFNQHD